MSIPTEDRISALPDSLICHILSFLTTKLAVTTSVLSKRWTPLWRSVLSLNFDDQDFTDFYSFRHFVDSVIDSLDTTLPLQSFRIKCCYSFDFDPRYVNQFVHAALQRGIPNLNFNVSNPGFHGLPKKRKPRFYDLRELLPSVLSILTCKTLVVLKLKNLKIHYVPHLVDLPILKTLNLVSINFVIDYMDFKRLLHGCPILENLQSNRLHFSNLPQDSEVDYKVLPKLVTTNISNCMQNFAFAWLHNAKFLRVELLSTYEYQVSTFHNLTHMELIFKTNNSWPDKWKWVIEVLQHCPKLQNLTVDEASHDLPLHEHKDWADPITVPECLSSQLRTCMLRGYNDVECELQFAEYIILNSKLLCTMTIKSTSLVDEKAKHQMLLRLTSYPRGSATCKLLVD